MFLESRSKRYAPDAVYTEVVRDGKKVSELMDWDHLDPEFKRDVLGHCPSRFAVIQRPGIQFLFDKRPYSVMKTGGGFSPEEVAKIVADTERHGLVFIPMLDTANGGGRGSRGWGILHFGRNNYIHEWLSYRGLLTYFLKLSFVKQLARVKKLLRVGEPIHGRVKIISFDAYPGLIYLSPRIMHAFNLLFGVKFNGVLKGIGVPMTPAMEVLYGDYDVLIPEGENKFKLSEEELEGFLEIRREISADKTYSKNLKRGFAGKFGKLARFGFDFRANLNDLPSFVRMEEIRVAFETRKWSRELAEEAFFYMKQDGDLAWNSAFPFAINGDCVKGSNEESLMNAGLKKLAFKRLTGRIPGSVYGTLIPLEYVRTLNPDVKVKEAWFLRWPGTVFVGTEYCIYNHCLAVPMGLIKLFGGDCDGDQGLIVHKSRLDWFLKYPRDAEKLAEWMKAPVKVDQKATIMTETEQFTLALSQLSGTGRLYNSVMAAADHARWAGWNREQVIEFVLKAYARYVQPKIDGMKYEANTEVTSTSAICLDFGIPIVNISRTEAFYRAFKGSRTSLAAVIAVAEHYHAKPNSRGFYERLAAKFAAWQLDPETKTFHWENLKRWLKGR